MMNEDLVIKRDIMRFTKDKASANLVIFWVMVVASFWVMNLDAWMLSTSNRNSWGSNSGFVM